MSNILNADFVAMWIRVGTPLIFAALGASICTQAGVVNLGLEGIMLISALMGVLGSVWGGSVWAGALVGILSGVVVSVIFAYFHLVLKANNVLCGTAVNTAATGLTVFVLQIVTGEKGNSSSLQSFVFPEIDIPLIKDLPVLGDIISGHNLLTYLAILMVVAVWFLLYKTPLGLRMRAMGEAPEVAASVGQSVNRIQFLWSPDKLGGDVLVYGIFGHVCKRYDGRTWIYCFSSSVYGACNTDWSFGFCDDLCIL